MSNRKSPSDGGQTTPTTTSKIIFSKLKRAICIIFYLLECTQLGIQMYLQNPFRIMKAQFPCNKSTKITSHYCGLFYILLNKIRKQLDIMRLFDSFVTINIVEILTLSKIVTQRMHKIAFQSLPISKVSYSQGACPPTPDLPRGLFLWHSNQCQPSAAFNKPFSSLN